MRDYEVLGFSTVNDAKTFELEVSVSKGGRQSWEGRSSIAVLDVDGEVFDHLPVGPPRVRVVGCGERSDEEERGEGEEGLELGVGSKLDFGVKDPDGDVAKIVGGLRYGDEILSRKVGEDIGLKLGGDGREHREEREDESWAEVRKGEGRSQHPSSDAEAQRIYSHLER